MSELTTHMICNQREKKKRNELKEPQQAIENKRKAKSKITCRRQVSYSLGKGNSSTHPRQNHAQAKEPKPPIQCSNNTNSSSCTCKLPMSQSTLPLNQCSNATWECNKEKNTAHFA
jgi:hypothetical protein